MPFPCLLLGEVKLSAIFSLEEKNLPFGGVNLPLGEKTLFLEEHSRNLLASFSFGAVNLVFFFLVL